MKKILLLLITASVLMFAGETPFLINGKMPHVTKVIKQNWDSQTLALTDAQKEKLLEVRKSTMNSVMKLQKEISPLEKEVAVSTMSGALPESLKAQVDQIAKLKAQATMAHIKCIYDTKNILDPKQLEFVFAK